VDPRKEEEELLCLKRSEEKENGLSLDLGVEELTGTARRECENFVAVKDIFCSSHFATKKTKKKRTKMCFCFCLRMWL
jgi:hypothetical protein